MINHDNTTFLTVVEQETDTLELMALSLAKFAPRYKLRIVSNNPKNEMFIRNACASVPNLAIDFCNPFIGGGSNRHGIALNYGIKLNEENRYYSTDGESYTCILENDAVLCSHKWNSIPFNKPGRHCHELIAMRKEPEPPPIGDRYYHVFFLTAPTKVLTAIDMTPSRHGSLEDRPYHWTEDVGWRIQLKVRPEDIHEMQFIDCKSGNGVIFDSSFQSDECHINGEPVVLHLGRGSHLSGKRVIEGLPHPNTQKELWKQKVKDILS